MGTGRAYLKHYSGIYLDRLCKTITNLNQDIKYLGKESNRESPEYKSTTLSLRLSVLLLRLEELNALLGLCAMDYA